MKYGDNDPTGPCLLPAKKYRNRSYNPANDLGIHYLSNAQQIKQVLKDVSVSLINIGHVMWDIMAFKQLKSIQKPDISQLVVMDDENCDVFVREYFTSLDFLEFSDLDNLVSEVSKGNDYHRENVFRKASEYYASIPNDEEEQRKSERNRLKSLQAAAKSILEMETYFFDEVNFNIIMFYLFNYNNNYNSFGIYKTNERFKPNEVAQLQRKRKVDQKGEKKRIRSSLPLKQNAKENNRNLNVQSNKQKGLQSRMNTALIIQIRHQLN
jgi:hypothetical protein